MLHRHLLRFFDHYGNKLNARDTGISTRAGGFLIRKSTDDALNGRGGHTRLYVESPLNRNDDAGEGAFNYSIVRKHFRVAHDLLFQYGPSTNSLLSLIISDQLFDYYS